MALTTIRRVSTSVTITDPLVKYRALVSTGIYEPDPAQHRLARHLQKIYGRLKDYTPSLEYQQRLRQITDITASPEPGEPTLAVESHPIWNNPLFKRLFTSPEGNNTLALTRVLTNHEAALEIDSPKGLFLSGEVGTGKSMLVDLLSEGLPTQRKRRWHFNTFMLYAFSQLERFRRSHPELSGAEQEYSLLWLAKTLVEDSPILFLDEFQLPDRAASKILSHLFVAFFQLGGVLVASSNRVPEELQKAIGVDYTPPPTGGFVRNFFGGGKGAVKGKGELFGSSSDFAAFLDVLKARCDFWHMEGATDWRRRESDVTEASDSLSAMDSGDAYSRNLNTSGDDGAKDKSQGLARPSKYSLSTDDRVSWCTTLDPPLSDWTQATLVVYGREIRIPKQRDGHVYWEFDRLVESFGPADYITMASTYHTFIIDNIPVMTISKKNEARRFITLLDALYEAKCKLVIRADCGPDDLFFPETKSSRVDAAGGDQVLDSDAIHSETIAEAYQDSSSPFRPNISFYDTDSATAKYDPDQDSDFVLEDSRAGSPKGQDRGAEGQGKKLDFGDTGAFTGEDERFAYKRAASRLWEMCSAQWHARTGEWWRPLPAEARHWERGAPSKPKRVEVDGSRKTPEDATMGPSVELEEPVGLQRRRIDALKKQDGQQAS